MTFDGMIRGTSSGQHAHLDRRDSLEISLTNTTIQKLRPSHPQSDPYKPRTVPRRRVPTLGRSVSTGTDGGTHAAVGESPKHSPPVGHGLLCRKPPLSQVTMVDQSQHVNQFPVHSVRAPLQSCSDVKFVQTTIVARNEAAVWMEVNLMLESVRWKSPLILIWLLEYDGTRWRF
jgi:hypothetical protein